MERHPERTTFLSQLRLQGEFSVNWSGLWFCTRPRSLTRGMLVLKRKKQKGERGEKKEWPRSSIFMLQVLKSRRESRRFCLNSDLSARRDTCRPGVERANERSNRTTRTLSPSAPGYPGSLAPTAALTHSHKELIGEESDPERPL